jgi:tetratricopeptide (TPR) repeat protein
MSRRRWALLGATALAALIGWAYWPILGNGLVWDDGGNLIVARKYWDGGLAGVRWAFAEPLAGHYQPLTWLSYRLDAALSGATPRGLHATQLFLHLLVTLAVAALAAELARSPALRARPALQGISFPLIAAALFGLAPIRVESVAWATERRDLLGALFTVAAVVLYSRSGRHPDWGLGPGIAGTSCRGGDRRGGALSSVSVYRAGVAVLAALSALSRAQMTLPLLLLLLDAWPLGRLDGTAGRDRLRALGRLVGEKALLLAIAAASAVAAMWAQASSGALTSFSEHGLLDRLVQAGFGLAFYPVSTFFPGAFGPLLPLYERPVPFVPLDPRYLLPAIAAAGALAAILVWRRRAPALFTAAGSYLLLVLPVLGIAQSGIQLVADRYAYLATIPLVLLAAAGIARLFSILERPAPRALLAVALIAILAAGAFATRRQTRVWQDDLSLWRRVLAHSGSSIADNNLGQILAARGEAGKALFHLTRCLEESPQYPRPWNTLAVLLEAPSPAESPPAPWVAATLAQALAWQPGNPAARYATALAHTRAGDQAQAERELRRLLAVDPAHDGAKLALARIETRK